MKTKAPPVRRKFMNAADEMNYLRDKVLFWLYQRAKPEKARPYAKRLISVFKYHDRDQESILGQECRSLAYEAIGDLARAIEHRKKEIQLIRRLQEISVGTPNEEYILDVYGPSDLSDRMDLLASLYRDNGNLDEAIAQLRESRILCEEQGVEFDGGDLLAEFLEERRSNHRS